MDSLKLIKIFAVSLFALILFTVIYIILSFGFLFEKEKYFIYAIVFSGFLLIFYSFKTKNKALQGYSYIFLFICILTYFTGSFLKEYQINQTKENAETVITLLNDYNLKNKEFPQDLKLLNKHNKLPCVLIGILPKPFVYEKLDGNRYLLSYKSFKYIETYNSLTKNWSVHD